MGGIQYGVIYKKKGLKKLKDHPEILKRYKIPYLKVNQYKFISNYGYSLILIYTFNLENINVINEEYAIIITKKKNILSNEFEYKYEIYNIFGIQYEYYKYNIITIYCEQSQIIKLEFPNENKMTMQFYIIGPKLNVDKILMFDSPNMEFFINE